MVLDLDNFKSLNDTYGHEVGDRLLIEAASRLTDCVRESDTVARFGGDEFVVMLGELNIDRALSILQAKMVAEKISGAFAEPYVLTTKNKGFGGIEIEHFCTASIGVAIFSDKPGTRTEILKWADNAMYEAKTAGRNAIRFAPETAAQAGE
jgi:diguanylate cyclase (GGDEF)-like protein